MGYQIHQNWQNMGRSAVVIAMSVYEILGYPDMKPQRQNLYFSSFTWSTHAAVLAVLAGVTCQGLPRNGRDARRGGRERHLRSLVNSRDLSLSLAQGAAPLHSSPISTRLLLLWAGAFLGVCTLALCLWVTSLGSQTEFYMRSLQEPPILRGERPKGLAGR